MASKKFYITGSLSILALFAMIAPFVEYYSDYSDVICGTECWTTFCLKNGNKDLLFYNKDELPLTFSPMDKVYSTEFYEIDSKNSSKMKKIDFVTPYAKNTKYVFKIPAYKKSCYGIKITKSPGATIKWTFDKLDPFFIGVNGNLSWSVYPGLNNSIDQNFAPNWSRAIIPLNFSDNATMAGNFSWNYSEQNVSIPSGYPWMINLTNNGTTNITISLIINGTKPDYLQLWVWNYSNKQWNISNTSYTPMFNLTTNSSRLINMTIDLFNISQRYINWTLNSSTAQWSFNISFNVTSY